MYIYIYMYRGIRVWGFRGYAEVLGFKVLGICRGFRV